MPESSIQPVVLCGGSGTRLWPLSRESLPKQFVPLIYGKSLLQATLERVSALQPVLCVANNEHRFFVQEAMSLAKVKGRQLLEPAGRNTAAAIACAAISSEAEALLLFLPADHYIPDASAFLSSIKSGVTAAQNGYVVTFGVQPSFPSTAYGYIQQGATLKASTAFEVKRFLEKPNLEKAQQLLLSGDHLWNAGIFLCSAAIEQLNAKGYAQASLHRRVARPWGWYDSIDMGERFQVKRIGVNPGASLSLQMHHHRAEHWIVVKGTAKVTNGERVTILAENESTFIPLGAKHRLRNPGKTLLEIIEVQSGSYLDEDDIVRFEDTYGRPQIPN